MDKTTRGPSSQVGLIVMASVWATKLQITEIAATLLGSVTNDLSTIAEKSKLLELQTTVHQHANGSRGRFDISALIGPEVELHLILTISDEQVILRLEFEDSENPVAIAIRQAKEPRYGLYESGCEHESCSAIQTIDTFVTRIKLVLAAISQLEPLGEELDQLPRMGQIGSPEHLREELERFARKLLLPIAQQLEYTLAIRRFSEFVGLTPMIELEPHFSATHSRVHGSTFVLTLPLPEQPPLVLTLTRETGLRYLLEAGGVIARADLTGSDHYRLRTTDQERANCPGDEVVRAFSVAIQRIVFDV